MTQCSFDACDNHAHAKGLCAAHYYQQRRGEVLRPLGEKLYRRPTCKVDGCDSQAVGRGYCGKHYQNWRNHGDPVGISRRPVGDGKCTVAGCEKRHSAQGYCSTHYKRWMKHGDPLIVEPARVPPTLESIRDRFWSKVEEAEDCWLWKGPLDRDGYGRISIDGMDFRAHRVAYEFEVGAIPEGHDLHHICEVKACVNPHHLEPLTAAEHKRLHWSQLSQHSLES